MKGSFPSWIRTFFIYSIRFLTHPIFIIFIGEVSIKFESSIRMKHSYGRMMNAIKHICFYRCIVNHVFKNDILPYFERMFK